MRTLLALLYSLIGLCGAAQSDVPGSGPVDVDGILLAMGCDPAQLTDRKDIDLLKYEVARYDSLIKAMPADMLTAGAKKKDVRAVRKEMRGWPKARKVVCSVTATSFTAEQEEGIYLSCLECMGRRKLLELSETFHRIIPKMIYRPYYLD